MSDMTDLPVLLSMREMHTWLTRMVMSAPGGSAGTDDYPGFPESAKPSAGPSADASTGPILPALDAVTDRRRGFATP
jgi:hypothetical protein